MDNTHNMIKKIKNMLAAQEGPPDLDELFKDLKGKLNSFLGGKTRQGPRGVPNEPNNTNGSDSIPVGPIILISCTYLDGNWFLYC